jgi:16S rRNA (guanine(966)-N(2))-methyltransferase RsmD
MAKESLFNILENEFDIEKLKVLDLFSGTGGISYEFLSRGCNDITCVEINYSHYLFIKKTVAQLESNNKVHVVKANAFRYLEKCPHRFNLIFADPPYNIKGIETIPDLVFTNNLLLPDGLLVVEHSADTVFLGNKYLRNHKKYGSVNFSFFENL